MSLVSDLLLSDMLRTFEISGSIAIQVSDLLLSDIHGAIVHIIFCFYHVSGRLLSDKRKHPLTALIGNEGMFFYLGVDNV